MIEHNGVMYKKYSLKFGPSNNEGEINKAMDEIKGDNLLLWTVDGVVILFNP